MSLNEDEIKYRKDIAESILLEIDEKFNKILEKIDEVNKKIKR